MHGDPKNLAVPGQVMPGVMNHKDISYEQAPEKDFTANDLTEPGFKVIYTGNQESYLERETQIPKTQSGKRSSLLRDKNCK